MNPGCKLPVRLPLLLPICLLALACTGQVSGSDRPGGPAPAPTPAPAPLPTTPGAPEPLADADLAPARPRQLTRTELRNSLRDVFFGGDDAKAPVLTDGWVKGFDNNQSDLSIHLDLLHSLQALAEKTSADVVARLPDLVPCGSAPPRECASRFVATIGLRLYRRPPTAEETQRLLASFDTALGIGSFQDAMRVIIETMILSPNFLFRTELGAERQGNVVALTGYERAATLSYFLWRTTADDPLLESARSGKLSTEAGLREQVARLLADPRARPTMHAFLEAWLGLRAAGVAKDQQRVFTPALAAAMAAESGRFFEEIFWSPESSWTALMTSRRSFVNAELSRHYGVARVTSPTLVPVELPADERGGILTLADFIVSHTPNDEFSPVHLGAIVRTELLCQELLDPPDNVPDPDVNAMVSLRSKFEMHRSVAQCAACHAFMDPIGFGFERYGNLGRVALMDRSGAALTGQGEIVGTDVSGRFVGAVQLGERLASSAQVKRCFVAKVLEYGLGRKTSFERFQTRTDRTAIDALLTGAFVTGDMKRLIAEMVTTRPFTHRDGSRLPR